MSLEKKPIRAHDVAKQSIEIFCNKKWSSVVSRVSPAMETCNERKKLMFETDTYLKVRRRLIFNNGA